MVDIIKLDIPTHPGGLDFTLFYTAGQARTLGNDAELMANAPDSALWAAGRAAPLRPHPGRRPARRPYGEIERLGDRDPRPCGAGLTHRRDPAPGNDRPRRGGWPAPELGDAMCSARSTTQDRLSAARARVAAAGPLTEWATETPDPADPIRGWRNADLARGMEP